MHNVIDKKKQKQYNGDTRQGKKNNAVVKRSGIFLITVNVLGSAGPMRFLVNESDAVATVIDNALKTFAREGRLPVLGFHVDNFLLYCANEGSDALSPSERIGQCGGRNFLLCKKQQLQQPQNEMMATDEQGSAAKTMNNKNAEKGSGWKAWIINKSLSFKLIIPHCH